MFVDDDDDIIIIMIYLEACGVEQQIANID